MATGTVITVRRFNDAGAGHMVILLDGGGLTTFYFSASPVDVWLLHQKRVEYDPFLLHYNGVLIARRPKWDGIEFMVTEIAKLTVMISPTGNSDAEPPGDT